MTEDVVADGAIQTECGAIASFFNMCSGATPEPEMLGTGMAAEAGNALQGRAAQLEAMEQAALGNAPPPKP